MRGPGKLDQRIRIDQLTAATDGPFQVGSTWAAVDTVWANVKPLNGNEAVNADAQNVNAKYKVTIRKRTDITGQMRLVWTSNGNKTLNIRELPDAGTRSLYQDIIVTSGSAD